MLKEVNESKFNMWRAIVALVHADGEAHPEEDSFLRAKFQNLPFTSEQLEALNADMESPKDVDVFFEKITSPGDRSQFIYFARLLFWSDGVFQEQEQAILDRLHVATISKVDLEKVMHSVDGIAEQFVRDYKNRNFRTILSDFIQKFFS